MGGYIGARRQTSETGWGWVQPQTGCYWALQVFGPLARKAVNLAVVLPWGPCPLVQHNGQESVDRWFRFYLFHWIEASDWIVLAKSFDQIIRFLCGGRAGCQFCLILSFNLPWLYPKKQHATVVSHRNCRCSGRKNTGQTISKCVVVSCAYIRFATISALYCNLPIGTPRSKLTLHACSNKECEMQRKRWGLRGQKVDELVVSPGKWYCSPSRSSTQS